MYRLLQSKNRIGVFQYAGIDFSGSSKKILPNAYYFISLYLLNGKS